MTEKRIQHCCHPEFISGSNRANTRYWNNFSMTEKRVQHYRLPEFISECRFLFSSSWIYFRVSIFILVFLNLFQDLIVQIPDTETSSEWRKRKYSIVVILNLFLNVDFYSRHPEFISGSNRANTRYWNKFSMTEKRIKHSRLPEFISECRFLFSSCWFYFRI